MTTARTQDKRHWVQIELEPSGDVTGAAMIDLNMVDKIQFNRHTSEPGVVDQVTIHYAGTMKPINLAKDNADWFYKVWLDFCDLKAAAPKAKPGLIHVTGKLPTY